MKVSLNWLKRYKTDTCTVECTAILSGKCQ